MISKETWAGENPTNLSDTFLYIPCTCDTQAQILNLQEYSVILIIYVKIGLILYWNDFNFAKFESPFYMKSLSMLLKKSGK